MLTESFIAASLAPPKLASSNSAALKDAGIFFHNYQPHPGLRTSFKKSTTARNCVAVSPSHIFAAQTDKAIIHIYNRAKGSQEAIASFPERITSIALVGHLFLAVGLQNGAISLWEILTGRVVATTQAHLQAVTHLAADSTCNFLLSAAPDSTVLVWLLADLLRLSATPSIDHQTIEPHQNLTAHRAAVTALAIGHSATGFDIAVSGSSDRTAILWNYRASDEPLATYLLPDAPLALAFDPADRAIYASYSDGSVQCIDILSPHFRASPHSARAPIQPAKSTIWRHPSPSGTDAATALSLSYDGTALLTGHASGKICAWSIADQRLSAEIADYPGAPITNLVFLPPTGLPSTKRTLETALAPASVVKPRMHDPFSGTAGNTSLCGTYAVHAQLTPLAAQRSKSRIPRRRTRKCTVQSAFTRAVQDADGFSAADLSAAADERVSFSLLSRVGSDVQIEAQAQDASSLAAASLNDDNGNDGEGEDDDFMALDVDVDDNPHATQTQTQTHPIADVNELLMSEVFALQRERTELLREREAYMRRRRRKDMRHAEKVDKHWERITGGRIEGLPGQVAREWLEKEEVRTGKKIEGLRWQSGSELSSDTDVGDEDDDEEEEDE